MSLYTTTCFTRDDLPATVRFVNHDNGRSVFLAEISGDGYVTYKADSPDDVDALAAMLLSAAHRWRLELKAPKVVAPKLVAPKLVAPRVVAPRVVAADGYVTNLTQQALTNAQTTAPPPQYNPIMPPAPPTGILWPNGTQTFTTDSGDAA